MEQLPVYNLLTVSLQVPMWLIRRLKLTETVFSRSQKSEIPLRILCIKLQMQFSAKLKIPKFAKSTSFQCNKIQNFKLEMFKGKVVMLTTNEVNGGQGENEATIQLQVNRDAAKEERKQEPGHNDAPPSKGNDKKRSCLAFIVNLHFASTIPWAHTDIALSRHNLEMNHMPATWAFNQLDKSFILVKQSKLLAVHHAEEYDWKLLTRGAQVDIWTYDRTMDRYFCISKPGADWRGQIRNNSSFWILLRDFLQNKVFVARLISRHNQ